MKSFLLLAVVVRLGLAAPAQNQNVATSTPTTNVRPLITAPLDETQRVVLKGNTHPLARTQYDGGAAPGTLPMERMLLVLKRSPEQESALRQLLDAQQDKLSPNYHKWVTPDEFGNQFGVDDSDLQIVTGWLQGHGLTVNRVSRGRTIIEFSGNAAQVQQAFGTTIHQYVVKGQQHWANASDPQIPSALAPVVSGIHTLHNFRRKPQLRALPQRFVAKYLPGTPPQATFGGTPPLHALAPADYRTIYNANPVLSGGTTGLGITIGVVGRSNLYGVQGGFNQPLDVLNFRGIFNMCCGSVYVVFNGADPGDLGGDEELEATLDASWAGAVAPDANVEFVVSASTNTTDGVDLSELYIIDTNRAQVMTESFGGCEVFLTSTEANGIATMAEQAAAQGITYLVSAGDSGSAGCDNPSVTPETLGPSVNVLASTPYTVAVGGTMFNENGQDSKYWSSTNNPADFGSALSYIPEKVWNESCTPATCAQNAGLWSGGGGSSIFFAKASWQAGFGPSDAARDLPDVSLTAGGHDPYLVCLQASCVPDFRGFIRFAGVGGTSASAPAFAGIMALVDQKMAGAQGQADYVLYRLAASETFSQCNGSGTTALPPASCTFYDTTSGNNCVPGEAGYPSSCTTYKSAVGYDLATGLGSVNINNLVNNWNAANFHATTTTLVIGPPTTLTHGSAISANVTVTSNSGMPTGDVSLSSQTNPVQTVSLCASVNACTLNPANSASGTVSVTTNALPGGTYNIYAHYAGDGEFAPSDSPPVSVTVNPEPSGTSLVVATGFDGKGNPIPFTPAPYGSLMYLRADVTGQSRHGTPTGMVQFLDNGTILTAPWQITPLGQLNSQGTAWTPNGIFTVGPGTRALMANYLGDASFTQSTSTPTSVTITQATTTATLQLQGSDSNGTDIVAIVDTPSRGNAPTGTVTFFSGGTPLAPAAPVTGAVNSATGTAQATAFISSPISGAPTLTATYSGDTNYVGSTSAPLLAAPDFLVQNNAGGGVLLNTRGLGSNLTITVSPVDSFTGKVTFTCSGAPLESTCTFNPVSLDVSPATPFAQSMVSITTTAPRAGVVPSPIGPMSWWTAIACVFFAGMFLVSGGRKDRDRRFGAFRVTTLVFFLMLMGCGGGGSKSSSAGPGSDPGTQLGTYTITVKATSGTTSHTTSFHLIVQ